METPVLILAVAGFVAVLRRLLGAALRVLTGGVDRYVAGQLATTRARHGDITGMREAEGAAATARERRRDAVARLLFWTGLLILPPFVPYTSAIYASYSLLWIVPPQQGSRG